MRLFIGFLIPEGEKDVLLKLQSEITDLGIECKNVERENIHLDLSFLGETPEEEVGRMKKDLETIAKHHRKFEVTLCSMKAIPSKTFIRVLALDVKDEGNILGKIQEEISQKIGGDAKPLTLLFAELGA